MIIHYLNIGKCAGTYIKTLCLNVNKIQTNFKYKLHDHSVKLSDIPINDDYFFSIRNPISRFYSTFYSRKRMGRPRYYKPWSEAEKTCFSIFDSANSLAESLSMDSHYYKYAVYAMNIIGHLKTFQYSYFKDIPNFLEVRPPVCILRQEFLEKDIINLKQLYNINEKINIDIINYHKNDYSNTQKLSDKAIKNLTIWYKKDLLFHKEINEYIESKNF